MSLIKKALFLLVFSAPFFLYAELGPFTQNTGSWVRNGEKSNLIVSTIEGEDYLTIDQMAGLSGAQLRWQSVTQQACLSNIHGFLCFNWERSQIQKDGLPTRNKVRLWFEDNRLFIPLKYALSKEFQDFCDADLKWDPKVKLLSQESSIQIGLPSVERLDDKYQLRLRLPEKGPYSLIEKSSKQIWVRLMRARSEGSQILEGDNVIREIKIIQRRRSADLIVKLGPEASSSDVYFDEGKKNLFVDVSTSKVMVRREEMRKTVKKAPIPIRSVRAPSLPNEKPALPKIKPTMDKSIRTFVIDAGHGGMDAGAIGVRGTLEKEINLEVAKALAKQLRKEKNVRVIMTRENDVFIPLNERTDMANGAAADLFVSIHCNSSLSSKSNGFETYYLSPDATDKTAESVARLENSVVTLESKKGENSTRLNQLLASMAVYEHINDSSRFASILCRYVREKTNMDKAFVKEADFYVLRGAQMPSVLIELEYLSNPISEVKLRSSRFRSHMVKAIADGILTFDRQIRMEKEAVASQIEKTVNRTDR